MTYTVITQAVATLDEPVRHDSHDSFSEAVLDVITLDGVLEPFTDLPVALKRVSALQGWRLTDPNGERSLVAVVAS
jgi:hypothetical protein